MILSFPFLHKDELLYSAIARYFDYLNEDRHKWITEHLFSSRTMRAVVEFPQGLNNLWANLPKGNKYKPDYLIDNHTLYPLFRAFINEDIHLKTVHEMLYGNGKGMKTRLGIVASTIKRKRNFYYCPSCITEQMDDGNMDNLDTFWNRIHQVPGVYVCTKHYEWLRSTEFTLNELNQHQYVSINKLLNEGKINLTRKMVGRSEQNQHHIKFTQSVDWIINEKLYPKEQDYYRNRYLEYLKDRSIVKPSGRVDVKKLKIEFLSFYPKEFLIQLDSYFEYHQEQSWLQMILQKNRKSFHPVRHILIMNFLANSVSNFFKNEYRFQPFGNGPWKCNSPICSKQINTVDIGYSYDINQIYGDFKCPCGYIFRKYRDGKGKVLQFGQKWEQELVRMIKEERGIYQVAETLKADVETIKKYAERNNVLTKWSTARERIKVNDSNPDKKLKNEHYDIWREARERNSELTKTQLRQLVPASYAWLYRNDRSFLDENSPLPVVNSGSKNVIWEERDEMLLKVTVQIVKSWELNNDKPRRLTKGAISEKTGKASWLENVPDKFPQTINYINSVVESVEDFQKRRVNWVIQQFENQQIKEWQVVRVAALRPDISDDLKKFIATKVEAHNKAVSVLSPNNEEFFPFKN